jgi:PAS domain S-box-containing protein
MQFDDEIQCLHPAAPCLDPALLHLATQAIGLAMIITDTSGLIVCWNRGAEELYGWSPQEAIGEPISTLLVLPSAEADAATILAPLAAGQPWCGEFPVRHKTGRLFTARISAWPIRDRTARVVGLVGLSEASTDSEDRALVRQLANVIRGLLPRALRPEDPAEDPAFDPDATAVEIVTRAFDPALRAAVDRRPHGTVLPVEGLTLAELDDLLASLVALAVHTATVAAERCGSPTEEIVASAALRLRVR